MPRVTIETSHALGQEEALRRLKQKISVIKDTYQGQFSDLCEQWNENTLSFGFKATGMKVSGTVTVEDSQVKLAAKVPLAAMVLKGVVQRRVRDELDKLLA